MFKIIQKTLDINKIENIAAGKKICRSVAHHEVQKIQNCSRKWNSSFGKSSEQSGYSVYKGAVKGSGPTSITKRPISCFKDVLRSILLTSNINL